MGTLAQFSPFLGGATFHYVEMWKGEECTAIVTGLTPVIIVCSGGERKKPGRAPDMLAFCLGGARRNGGVISLHIWTVVILPPYIHSVECHCLVWRWRPACLIKAPF